MKSIKLILLFFLIWLFTILKADDCSTWIKSNYDKIENKTTLISRAVTIANLKSEDKESPYYFQIFAQKTPSGAIVIIIDLRSKKTQEKLSFNYYVPADSPIYFLFKDGTRLKTTTYFNNKTYNRVAISFCSSCTNPINHETNKPTFEDNQLLIALRTKELEAIRIAYSYDFLGTLLGRIEDGNLSPQNSIDLMNIAKCISQ